MWKCVCESACTGERVSETPRVRFSPLLSAPHGVVGDDENRACCRLVISPKPRAWSLWQLTFLLVASRRRGFISAKIWRQVVIYSGVKWISRPRKVWKFWFCPADSISYASKCSTCHRREMIKIGQKLRLPLHSIHEMFWQPWVWKRWRSRYLG